MDKPPDQKQTSLFSDDGGAYSGLVTGIVELLDTARKSAARSVNSIMTTTYWEIGRRIVQTEQGGQAKADYGTAVVEKLSEDLTTRFGRGFRRSNLFQMRAFYLAYAQVMPPTASTASEELASIIQTLSGQFPLPWSHYAKLISIKDPQARAFYEAEALKHGWSVRQMSRQISTQFYERTLIARNKAAILESAAAIRPGDAVTPEEEIRDPFILEFLDLKDEYSESDLESALIHHIEHFLLELGGDFAFMGRQRRLRIGDQWFRVDLVFFHRRLRCLVIVDLKLGEFSYADAGQMHLYLNYAREHWMYPGENPPVGLILCNKRDEAIAHYALEGLANKVMAAEYQMVLPNEKLLVDELERTRQMLESRMEGDSTS